jgi:hypothetical protein
VRTLSSDLTHFHHLSQETLYLLASVCSRVNTQCRVHRPRYPLGCIVMAHAPPLGSISNAPVSTTACATYCHGLEMAVIRSAAHLQSVVSRWVRVALVALPE